MFHYSIVSIHTNVTDYRNRNCWSTERRYTYKLVLPLPIRFASIHDFTNVVIKFPIEQDQTGVKHAVHDGILYLYVPRDPDSLVSFALCNFADGNIPLTTEIINQH